MLEIYMEATALWEDISIPRFTELSDKGKQIDVVLTRIIPRYPFAIPSASDNK